MDHLNLFTTHRTGPIFPLGFEIDGAEPAVKGTDDIPFAPVKGTEDIPFERRLTLRLNMLRQTFKVFGVQIQIPAPIPGIRCIEYLSKIT